MLRFLPAPSPLAIAAAALAAVLLAGGGPALWAQTDAGQTDQSAPAQGADDAGSGSAPDGSPPDGSAPDGSTPPDGGQAQAAARPFHGCGSRTLEQTFADMAAAPPSSLQAPSYVLPGGETTDFTIDRFLEAGRNRVFCAWIVWDDRTIRPQDQWASIESGTNTAHGQCKGNPPSDAPEAFAQPQRADIVSITAGAGGSTTIVRVALPPVDTLRWNVWCAARLVLALYEEQPDGSYTVTLDFDRIELFSGYTLSLILTLVWVVFVYLACALANGQAIRRRARRAGATPPPYGAAVVRSLNPVVMTAEADGHASLSNMQIFGFSLLVSALVLFILLRLGTLAALSPDVLLLLGISAAGTAAGRVTDASRNRLSFQNVTWLRRKGWLSGGEVETKWSQLFTSDGALDVTKLQMGAFSLIVAVALALLGSSDLSTFDIPDTLLGVLGLSQGVFVAGRATAPSLCKDYDKQLTATRAAEEAYRQEPSPGRLEAYTAAAEEAGEMHHQVFGERPGATAMAPLPPLSETAQALQGASRGATPKPAQAAPPHGDAPGGGAGSGSGAAAPAPALTPAPTPAPSPALGSGGIAAAAAPQPRTPDAGAFELTDAPALRVVEEREPVAPNPAPAPPAYPAPSPAPPAPAARPASSRPEFERRPPNTVPRVS